jgi:RHS repeat-associated protein
MKNTICILLYFYSSLLVCKSQDIDTADIQKLNMYKINDKLTTYDRRLYNNTNALVIKPGITLSVDSLKRGSGLILIAERPLETNNARMVKLLVRSVLYPSGQVVSDTVTVNIQSGSRAAYIKIGKAAAAYTVTVLNTNFSLNEVHILSAQVLSAPHLILSPFLGSLPCTKTYKRTEDMVQISWPKSSWANEYQLEYTFVSDYLNPQLYLGIGQTRRYINSLAQLNYSFRNNATRITTNDTNCSLPLVFESGYLVYRVRPLRRKDQGVIYGAWSISANEGSMAGVADTLNLSGKGYERDLRYWSIHTTFMEEGKRRDMVSLFDGTNRERQTLTKIYSTGDIKVSQIFYDSAGRGVVNELSAPDVGINNWGYRENYTRNEAGQPFSRADFDIKGTNGGIGISRLKANTASGAAKYFSSANPQRTGAEALLPDANGYVFTQTEYTADQTGRISRQGNVGEKLGLGSGHEKKYIYSVPSQEELDRLFGNEAGNHLHYKKKVEIDENGQLRVSYMNQSGRVVATAMQGNCPSNLEAIPDSLYIWNEEVRQTALKQNDGQTTSANKKEWSQVFAITQEQSTYKIYYTNNSQNICFNSPQGRNCMRLCGTCYYTLRLRVTSNRQQLPLFERTYPLSSAQPFSDSLILNNLPIGEYCIYKSLQVNMDSIGKFTDQFINANANCYRASRRHFQEIEEMHNGDPICELKCDGEKDNSSYCNIKPGFCGLGYIQMMSDLSPGGQYGAVSIGDSNFWYAKWLTSIFNDSMSYISKLFPVYIEGSTTQIRPDWRHPLDWSDDNGKITGVTDYRDELGNIVYINGRLLKHVSPQTFLDNWKPHYAKYLLPFHPEFDYYRYCINKRGVESSSALYIDSLQKCRNIQEALTNNLISNGEFRIPPLLKGDQLLTDRIKNYVTLNREKISLYKLAYATVACAAVLQPGISDCISTLGLPDKLDNNSPFMNDRVYEAAKGLYISLCDSLSNVFRRNYIKAEDYRSNACIGDGYQSSCDYEYVFYRDKTPCFPLESNTRHRAVLDSLRAEQLRQGLAIQLPDVNAGQCNTCSLVTELEGWLNNVTRQRMLNIDHRVLLITPLSAAMQQSLGMPLRGPNDIYDYRWVPQINNNSLKISIYGKEAGTPCIITLTANNDNFKSEFIEAVASASIVRFTCFQPIGKHEFSLKAQLRDREITLTGSVSCLDLKCENKEKGCAMTPGTEDLKPLIQMVLDLSYSEVSGDSTFYNVNGFPQNFPLPNVVRLKNINGKIYKWRLHGIGGRVLRGVVKIFNDRGQFIDSIPIQIKSNPNENVSELGKGVQVDLLRPAIPRNENDCANDTFFAYLGYYNKDNLYKYTSVLVSLKGIDVVSCCVAPMQAICCAPLLPYISPSSSCESAVSRFDTLNANIAFRNYMQFIRDSLIYAATTHCLKASEEMQFSFRDQLYNATLYYYNQADNLVKTIPPKGVKALSGTALVQVANARKGLAQPVFPLHQMPSIYYFNTLNQLTKTLQPDADTARQWYDPMGRVILAQSARQLAYEYHYTKYDALGRIVESGLVKNASPIRTQSSIPFRNYTEQQYLSFIANGTCTEVSRLYYDSTLKPIHIRPQSNDGKAMRGRLAASTYDGSDANEGINIHTDYDAATFYEYDIHGVLCALKQDIPDMGTIHRVKSIDYRYDLISGKMKEIHYQQGAPDQFSHRYIYDKDQRMTEVYTSTNGVVWDKDLFLNYYRYGALASSTIGHYQLQQKDFVYTIQGWLKQINGDSILGADANSPFTVCKDIYGFNVGYFTDDYTPVGNGYTTSLGNRRAPQVSLFDGGIGKVSYQNQAFSSDPLNIRLFKYDQAKRLVNAFEYNPTDATLNLQSRITYDLNGNISSMLRHGSGKQGYPLLIDSLVYNYQSQKNQLDYVSDVVADGNYKSDIDNQLAGNYTYDKDGNMISDRAEGIRRMTWNKLGKLDSLIKMNDTVIYKYNGSGQRVAQIGRKKSIYYILDPLGKQVAVYRKDSANRLVWDAASINEVSRVGEYQPHISPDSMNNNHFVGRKVYELSDLTGNILLTISDRKYLEGGRYKPTILSANRYDAFGMVQAGFDSGYYRFGFQGMEKDNLVKGAGNDYTTDFRQYDPRLGRWMSVDVLSSQFPSISPYAFAGNNPISYIDGDGQQVVDVGSALGSAIGQQIDDGICKAGGFATGNITELAYIHEFSDIFWEDNISQTLIERYSSCSGEAYVLTSSEMEAIHAIRGGIKGSLGLVAYKNDGYNKKLDKSQLHLSEALSKLKPGESVTYTDRVFSVANTNGTLGRFYIVFEGKLTKDAKDPNAWSFEGTMEFTDRWDFITDPKAESRGSSGEFLTSFGKNVLFGRGFLVRSEKVKVKQNSKDDFVDWFINKPDDVTTMNKEVLGDVDDTAPER